MRLIHHRLSAMVRRMALLVIGLLIVGSASRAGTLPAITTPPTGQSLPTGWSSWFESSTEASAKYGASPVSHLAVRIYNGTQWSLDQSTSFTVQAGQVWTYTAVIGGRNLGCFGNGGGAISLVAYNSQDQVVDWALGDEPWDNGTVSWKRVSVTVTIPTGVAKIRPRFYGFGGGEYFIADATCEQVPSPANLTIPATGLPPVTQTLPISPLTPPALPSPWGFWAATTALNSAYSSSSPVDHLRVQMGTADQWALSTGKSFAVQAGQTWTFTAVIAARNLGWLTTNGAAASIIASDANGNIVSWGLGEHWDYGTFNWKRVAVTVTVPSGVVQLSPRFWGYGGGEYYLAAATFLPTATEAGLTVPGTMPSLVHYTVAPPISTSQTNGIYAPGAQIQWSIAPNCTRTDAVSYTIKDANGTTKATGTTALRGTVSYTPTENGYFEVNLSGTILDSNLDATISQRCGASSLPTPAAWSVGRNPFGFNGGDQTLLSRVGVTWTRPLYYDIVTGSHSQLPTDLTAYANAWEAKMLAGMPALENNAVEVWNEPTNELAPGWTMSQFVGMVNATRTGIRRVSSTTKIMVNWEWPSTFASFHDAGGAGLYNVMAIHPYSMSLWNNPPTSESPEKNNLLNALAQYRQVLIDDGLSGSVEIWSTEFGWPTYPGYGWSTTELNQARFIARSSLIQLASGLKAICPFSLGEYTWDNFNGSFGLLRPDGTPKPAFQSYCTLAQTIDNLPYAGRFNLGTNVGAYLFGTTNKTVIALWNPNGDTNITLTLASGTKTIVELFGKTTTTTSTNWTRTIGKSPIYLIINASPSQVATTAGRTLLTGAPPSSMFQNVTE